MNPQDLQQQEKLQIAAERAERECLPAGDPQVDAYRLVWRALKQPLPIALPADFAQQVLRKLQVREEAAGLEQWLTSILMVTMAIAAAFFALPPLAATLAPVLRATAAQPMPWSLMFVAVLGMAAVWLMDAAVVARRR
jgi:hypothetical protein